MPEITENPNVIAVVTAFNRRLLVEQVINALLAQSRPVDRIVVVDNGSTDGTRQYLRSVAGITIIESAENGGGAGGFARGLAWAMEAGATHAWLMDDDAVPETNCLELLVNVAQTKARVSEYAFVCPRVIDSEGRTGPRNFPLVGTDFANLFNEAEEGLLAVRACTFVGPLVSLNIARRTHLPLADFFIWHDDMEYTARLGKLAPAVTVPRAHIKHLAVNKGPDQYNGPRNFYNIRNLIWWAREAKLNESFNSRSIIQSAFKNARSQFRAAPSKYEIVRVLARALKAGITSRPKHQIAGDVCREIRRTDVIVVTDPASTSHA